MLLNLEYQILNQPKSHHLQYVNVQSSSFYLIWMGDDSIGNDLYQYLCSIFVLIR